MWIVDGRCFAVNEADDRRQQQQSSDPHRCFTHNACPPLSIIGTPQ